MSAISLAAIERRAPPIGIDEIERAIERDELFVVYRPQARFAKVDASPRVEALLRWRHPRWGALPPDSFMPRASRAGLGTILTEWLLSATLRQTREWRRAGDDVEISIDLWPADMHPHIAGTLAAALEFSGATPGGVTCEIPENAIAENTARAAKVASELNWLGVRIAIDGFGTSPAAFAQLRGMQLDELKLAAELVESLDVSTSRTALALTAVASAQALGVEVVACGVRTAEDLVRVKALGCDAAEGPAVSAPLDAASALEWLRARSHVR